VSWHPEKFLNFYRCQVNRPLNYAHAQVKLHIIASSQFHHCKPCQGLFQHSNNETISIIIKAKDGGATSAYNIHSWATYITTKFYKQFDYLS